MGISIASGKRNPCRIMTDFFEYMEEETEKFRERYADSTKEYFPGYDYEEHKQALSEGIAKNEVWIIKKQKQIVALLLFSKKKCELEYLTVHPDYRRRGLASRLIETMAAQFEVGTEISAITYREGDELGEEARQLYRSLGFQEGKELILFDYPCQRLKFKVRGQ